MKKLQELLEDNYEDFGNSILSPHLAIGRGMVSSVRIVSLVRMVCLVRKVYLVRKVKCIWTPPTTVGAWSMAMVLW